MWFRSKSRSQDLFSLDLLTEKVQKVTCNAMRIYDFVSYTSTLETIEHMK